MKTKYIISALVIMLGTAVSVYAGNHPALPAGPGISLSSIHTGYEIGPKGHKTTFIIPGSVVEVGAWYRTCPGMPGMILNPKSSTEVVLSNGKKMMLACFSCKEDAEKNPAKYKMYTY